MFEINKVLEEKKINGTEQEILNELSLLFETLNQLKVISLQDLIFTVINGYSNGNISNAREMLKQVDRILVEMEINRLLNH